VIRDPTVRVFDRCSRFETCRTDGLNFYRLKLVSLHGDVVVHKAWPINCKPSFGHLSMKSILLVEDSKFFRLAGKRVLARAGYRVTSTDNGEHALPVVQQFTPDLISFGYAAAQVSGLRFSAFSRKV
jgi:hypothetical protein